MTRALFERLEKEQLSLDEQHMLLKAAQCFSKDATIEGILASEGASYFRLSMDDLELISALLITDTELCMWLVGGNHGCLKLVPTFLQAVEGLARECGCKRIRSTSRPGVVPTLKDLGYHCIGYAMVKEI